MKHKILSVTFVLALLLGCSAVFSVSAASRPTASNPGPLPSQAASSEYLVKTHNNIVCVYHDGELVCTTGIQAASLPQSDRTMLETGIRAQSAAELASLLEDLGA